MRLKHSIFITLLLIATIPIIIISVFAYDRYTDLIAQQTTQVADHIFEQSKNKLNTNLNNIHHISKLFNIYTEGYNSMVDELKKFSTASEKYTAYDINKSNQKIRFTCQSLVFTYDYINGIFIFTPSGVTLGYGYGGAIVQTGYDPTNDDWYQKTLEQDGNLYIDGLGPKEFLRSSQNSISFSQSIYDVDTKQFLGVVFIDCSPEFINLTSLNSLPKSIFLSVEDDSGNTLYSNTPKIKEANVDLRKTELSDGLSISISVNNQDLFDEFGATRVVLISIASILVFTIMLISILVSHLISNPITHLTRTMERQEGSHLDLSSKYLNRADEIGILYNVYNRMAKTLNDYIQRELQNKLIILDSQMKSLEAQINSHFLYNTLESINSMAEIHEVDDISVMSLALGDMFRYSIKTKSELVLISDELKHVNNYIAIQQIRFSNHFDMVSNIPPEMQQLRILKLILQPLVENALYHGLERCHCGSSIQINGSCDAHRIIIKIKDDGIGMTAEELQNLQHTLSEKARFTELGHRTSQSIGIKNIQTRIQLYYGEEYGLSVHSIPQKGTEFTITLPRI